MFEILFSARTLQYVSKRSLVSKNQHWFPKGKSTNIPTLLTFEIIHHRTRKSFLGLFFDFSSAFDLVDQKLLCST